MPKGTPLRRIDESQHVGRGSFVIGGMLASRGSTPTSGGPLIQFTLAAGKIVIGNGSGNAAEQTLSGDATLSNTGVLTLGTVPIAKGGTGAITAAAALSNLGVGTEDSPTFAGLTLTGVLNLGAGLHRITHTTPEFAWYESDQAADAKHWKIYAAAAQYIGALVNDANSAATNWLRVTRTGYQSPLVRLDERVGIGADPTSRIGLNIAQTNADTSGSVSVIGIQVAQTNDPAAATSSGMLGASLSAVIAAGNAQNHNGGIVGFRGGVTHAGTGAAADMRGIDTALTISSTGTITIGSGVQVRSPSIAAGGSIGTLYGLYIARQKVTGVTTGYGLYQADAGDPNFLAGSVGIGVVPATALHVSGADARLRLESTSVGASALSRTMHGLELVTFAMSATAKYGAGLKFLSDDPEFTTETPKFLAAIIPRATETYGADTAGGMALDFFTTPNGPGATSVPVFGMTLSQNGQIGIGTDTPNAAAALEVASTTRAFLPPRMTTVQRDAIGSPPDGALIYNTTTNQLNLRASGAWVAVT